jgi:hypothetical protein
MKIKLTETQYNTLIKMNELGIISSKEKMEYTPNNIDNLETGVLWKDSLNLSPYYDYAIVREDKRIIDIYLHDGKKKHLMLNLFEYEDGYMVVNIVGSKEISGQGIGVRIYDAVVNTFKKPLYSGSSQTIFSRLGIWKKLMDMYPDRIVGFHNGSNQYLEYRDGELYAGDCPVYGHDEDCGDVRLKLLP